MKKFKATIHVFIKPAVLNPAEEPIRKGLHNLGFTGLSKLTMGKCFVLTHEAVDENTARKEINEMCKKLLVNLVTENFDIVSITEV